MGSDSTITVLEHSRVAPELAVAEFLVPLTFFDMLVVNYEQVPRLLFYDFPYSKAHFVEKIIPSLKSSLSLALKHYLPLAGNLIYPMKDNTGKPTMKYAVGDSVSITFAECNDDFALLKENQARDADKFFPLMAQMPPSSTNASDSRVIPLLALQVTLFPNSGVIIGLTNHHVIGDANAVTQFLKVWASINKFGSDAEVIDAKSLPFFDRATIKDPYGLDSLIWNEVKKGMLLRSPRKVLPTYKFRATFVLESSDIDKLKNLLSSKRPNLAHASTFVVTCAHIWTCWLKSGAVIGEEVKEDETVYFVFVAECRSRLDPPLPNTYFGNCLVGLTATSLHGQLTGKDGFFIAAEAIGNAVHKKMPNKGNILEDFQSWLLERLTDSKERAMGVTGSPKFDACDADFGWGKPEKCEHGNIDGGGLALNKSRKFEGGVEIGLVLPKARMDAFAAAFAAGLTRLAN